MLDKTITIKGTLTPTTPRVITETDTVLRLSLGRNSLCKMVLGKVSQNTVVEMNCSIKAPSGHSDALDFIDQLGAFIQFPEVAKLKLEGAIMVTVETEEDPITIRANVQHGKVTYKTARLIWE